MNRPCIVSEGANESTIGSQHWIQLPVPKRIHVLSVCPMDRGKIVHDPLLEEPNSWLSAARNQWELTVISDFLELYAIPGHEDFQAAILHSTLSSFELDDAGRFIRHRWPRARILVVYAGEDFLEDALYDDRVTPNVAPEILLSTIERMIEKRQDWRHGDVD